MKTVQVHSTPAQSNEDKEWADIIQKARDEGLSLEEGRELLSPESLQRMWSDENEIADLVSSAGSMYDKLETILHRLYEDEPRGEIIIELQRAIELHAPRWRNWEDLRCAIDVLPLRQWMKEKKVSIVRLADEAGVGKSSISRYCQGPIKGTVQKDTALKVCRALDLSPSQIYEFRPFLDTLTD